jgi:gliding motility-associated-like protein
MKSHLYTPLLSLLFFVNTANINAQQLSSCTNADFEMNNFNNWVGSIGGCCPVSMNTNGIYPGRHTIVSGGGFDPHSLGLIPLVPPGGGSYTVRLGNDNAGSQAEKLSYSFTVTSQTALFIYRYAVVLQDPSHQPSEQPRFSIRVFDQSGNAVSCGTYDVVSSANIPGFMNNGSIRFKPWTTVGIELSNLIGQTLTIEFTTADCGLGAHFGYAYFDCYCSPFQINSDFCPGANTTTLYAPPGFTQYLWSTGDTTSTVIINNPVVGTSYSVVMTSVTGCSVTLNTVLTPTNMVANFTTAYACMNGVGFIDSSYVLNGSPVTSWQWNFGDGSTGTGQFPVHTYASPGTYTVQLVTNNNSGCNDTITKTITVFPSPQVAFSFTPGCPGTPVSFTDLSTYSFSTITQWEWNFHDGSPIDTNQHPTHVFAGNQPFNISLTVTGANGCYNSDSLTVNPFITPAASFVYSSTCNNTTVYFMDSSQYVCGPVTSYYWNLGDGSTSSGQGYFAHTYPAAGIYNVTLVVGGLGGSTDTIIQSVIVPSIPTAAIGVTDACLHDSNFFTDQSVNLAGNIVTWSWDFGDGTLQSGSQSVSHIYDTTGIYYVSLIVTTDFNCTDTITVPANVWELPVADFIPDTLEGCEPLPVNFTDLSITSTGTITGWEWLFGNSLTDTVSAPLTIYPAGTYSPGLVAISNLGCRDTVFHQNLITAYALPEPTFSYSPDPVSAFFPIVHFTNLTENIIWWKWDFGNGYYSYERNPSHNFMYPGVYPITLVVESPEGCINEVIRNLEVKEEYAFYFPNTFTPNGDGKNDHFRGEGVGIANYLLMIFDRWGNLLYQTNNQNEAWDGNYNDLPASQGIYGFLAEMKDIHGKQHRLKGVVNLIR